MAGFGELGEGFGGGFWVGEVEVADGGGDDVGDEGAGGPFLVGGDDVPGGPFGAGGGEGFFVGFLVVGPLGAGGDVGGGEFPVFGGVVEAFEEAFFLFVLGEVEEEFEDEGAVADEVSFEGVDVVVAGVPEAVAAFSRGEALGVEDFGVDFGDEDFFVVGAVEDADAAAFGEVAGAAPEEVVVELFGGGLFEAEDLAALGVDAGHDVLDGAVFAGGVHGLEEDQDGVGVCGVEELLGFGELGAVLVKDRDGLEFGGFLAGVFEFAGDGPAGFVVFELDFFIGGDAELFEDFGGDQGRVSGSVKGGLGCEMAGIASGRGLG